MGGSLKVWLTRVKPAVLAALGVVLIASPAAAQKEAADLGKKVYESRCIICHGEKGDGKGLVGIVHRAEKRGLVWVTYPRDFTTGVFKFRSTLTGELPTDDDLVRIVRNGIPRSGMPSHIDLPEKEIRAAVAYVKTFSRRWKEEKPGKPIAIKMSPEAGKPASVVKGEKVWNDMKCWECHGKTGKGDGTKAKNLKDDWGDFVLTFDFTSGTLKGGDITEDIYRTFTTGVDGTPMPSYADSLKERDRWDLVSYTLKLMGKVK